MQIENSKPSETSTSLLVPTLNSILTLNGLGKKYQAFQDDGVKFFKIERHNKETPYRGISLLNIIIYLCDLNQRITLAALIASPSRITLTTGP